MNKNNITCQNCGKQFAPDHPEKSKSHTCSVKCRGELRSKQSPKVELVCENCGIKFMRYPSKVKNGRNFCGKKCWEEYWTNNASGWISSAGYRYICVDGREVFQHRYVMECHIGRRLFDNEIVHHINGNILDNRVENLRLMTRDQHTTHHNTGKSRKGQTRQKLSDETKAKISATMKRTRSERFWSTRK